MKEGIYESHSRRVLESGGQPPLLFKHGIEDCCMGLTHLFNSGYLAKTTLAIKNKWIMPVEFIL